MFPLSHVYMLNMLVNKDERLNRDLDERDSLQILGSWLLDAVITDPVREKTPNTQKFFHGLNYFAAAPKTKEIEKVLAGIQIHVLCDNLANKGRLVYSGNDDGFLAKMSITVPLEGIKDDFRTFKRKFLECGIDILVVRKAEEQLRQLFVCSTDPVKYSKISEDIYSMFKGLISAQKELPEGINYSFIENALYDACKGGLREMARRYADLFYYISCDCRRTKSARMSAGKEYSDKYCMVELIEKNIRAFDGWEQDMDDACSRILNARPDLLSTFEK